MLKGLKKGGKPAEKETKKDTKKKTEKPVQKFDEEEDDDAAANIVDVDYSKKQQVKPKQQPKKTQQSLLQEKDISNIVVPQKKKQEQKLKSWVPQSQQAAINFKSQVKLDETDFESITDQELNKQLKQKKAQKQQQKAKVVEQRNQIMFAPLANGQTQIKIAQIQRTQQQKKMLQDDGMIFSKKKPVVTTVLPQSKFATEAIVGEGNLKFAPLQKTPQQLRQEQAERQEQQIRLNKKKEISKMEFKETPMVFKGNAGFADLKNDTKVKGTRRMDDDDGLVILSKAEKQQRARQRQQRQQRQKYQDKPKTKW